MDNLSWNVVSTGGGDIDGLNNSMIEHFTGNYNYFLAREIIQNSLDAKRKGPTNSLPVQVVFRLEYLTSASFPGFDELVKVIESSKKFWKHHAETLQFLNKAERCLHQKQIPFLRISDFNTTGLSGSDADLEGGWFNLVRSTGASSKSAGEGGSFGIGKGAPFAASDLRTVFYSTKNEKAESAFQGKAELVSFKDESGDVKRGVCSFGVNQKSVRKLEIIPEKFWRQIQGTDIVIAGYKVTGDWVEDLLKSILRNFWYAIHCKDLEVEIELSIINFENLSEYLVKYFANEPFKDYVEPTGNPLQYYLAVVQGQELGKGQKLKNLDECKFFFKLIESHMNYVAMLRRSHMVIYSRRFNFPGNFAGVFICDNEKGNLELRKMEPPAHDKWDPKRHKENGESIMNELTNFVRGCLEKMKQSESFGILEIPELQKYLPFDEGDESGGSNGAVYTGKEGKTETSKRLQKNDEFNSKIVINPFKVSIINEHDEFGGNEEGGNNDDSTGNEGTRGSGGGNGNKRVKKIKDLHSRCYLISEKENQLIYRIIVRSKKDIKSTLKLAAVGEEGGENLRIVDVYDDKRSKFFFSGNKIQQFSLIQNVTKEFNIVVESPFKLALKIEAHDIQQ